ncbi:MAG: tetratricopeptide repeat protein, partial [Candidatus Krumholzibacteriia bacterium]
MDAHSQPACGPRRRRRRRLALVATLAAALAMLAADGFTGPGAIAQVRRSYTLDEDPIRQGDKALERADLDEAARRYEEAVAAGYRLERAFFGLAEIAVRRGRYADAEAGYRRALAAAGDRHPIARARLGLLLLRQGREIEAQQEFDRALAEDAKVWAAHYGLARLHLAAGAWDKAKAELDHGRGRRGVAEGEDAYQHGLALYLLGTGDREGAERAALLAMHLNPGDPE